MKTVIIGGGRGCRSLIGLSKGNALPELEMDIVAVADINPEATGMRYASQCNIATYTSYTEAMSLPGIELIIELTGSDAVLQELYSMIKPGMKLIDHTFTQLFWDLVNIREDQKWQLNELEKLEIEVEQERYFLQSIFNSSADMAVVLDLEMKILRANTKFYEFTNGKPDTVLGKHCWEVLRNTNLECDSYQLFESLREVQETGKPHLRYKMINKEEETHWEITRAPIFDQKRNIVAMLCSWHRITEKVMLRQQIESAEQKFKSFINSAKDWMSIKDLNGNYVIVNPPIAQAFGYQPDDFIGKPASKLLPKYLARTILKHDKEVIDRKEHILYDEIIEVDGKERHFKTVRFPLNDYRGEMIGVCTIARDMTREVRLQEQLIQTEKLAALGKLAAGVAHEINNPLTGILAFAEDIREEYPDDKYLVEDLDVIIRETMRCRDIVRNLLDFSRQDKPVYELSNVNTVVDSSLTLVLRLPQFRDIAIYKKTTKVPDIQCDPKQIQQVVLNFMLNAADAMKYRGTIILRTGFEKSKDICYIEVEDTGPGIPENLLDKLFEPFFSTKGTSGLGLAVSWGIIERHGGNIEVDMAERGGAVFKILLPAHSDTKN